MKRILVLLRGTELVANHVIGKNHSLAHRKIVGSVIMSAGVFLAHTGAAQHILVAIPLDVIGYSLHAIGCVPFIKSIEDANDSK